MDIYKFIENLKKYLKATFNYCIFHLSSASFPEIQST